MRSVLVVGQEKEMTSVYAAGKDLTEGGTCDVAEGEKEEPRRP